MGGELRVRKVQIVIGLAVIVGLTLGVVITILYCTLAESVRCKISCSAH